MIVDKNPQSVVPESPATEPSTTEYTCWEEEAAEINPMVESYRAVRSILQTITEDPNDPDSPPLFKTIKLDNGQLARLKYDVANREYGIVFPAVFIHFINVYYNVGASNIAEGKGTMRIHYVLNRLNNSDDDVECEGLEVYQRIIAAIESQKTEFPALVQRFQLEYWDQPLSFDNALQPYWIDYQIWFRDYTGYAYKNYKQVYITTPPFTQPSDQNAIANPDNLPDYTSPDITDAVKFEGS